MTPALPRIITTSQEAWKLLEKDYTLRLSLVASEWAAEHLRAWNAVFAEGRRRGNSAYYGPALVDMEIADMDKRAQWNYGIFCEIWEIQGRKKCRPFFQTMFDHGINPMLSTREGRFRYELELHLKRTRRGFSQGLPAIMHSMKQRAAQLRAKWNTKIEVAARDAENQDRLAREPEAQSVSAPAPSMVYAVGDPGRTDDLSWQQLSIAFAKLAEEENGKRCLGVMATQELNHPGDIAVWTINDSYSENFKARFELLASQAGKSLGPLPGGATPFFYWLHRLYQHLREERSSLSRFQIYTSESDAGNQVSLECPLVESACEASSTFCLRLQKRALENGHEGKEISVCYQDWIENNLVSVSMPAKISERNSVSLVAESAQIPIPIEFLSSRLQEIRMLRGSVAFGSPSNFLDVKAETHGLMWAITRRGLWMAQQPPSAGVYIDAHGMHYGMVSINETNATFDELAISPGLDQNKLATSPFLNSAGLAIPSASPQVRPAAPHPSGLRVNAPEILPARIPRVPRAFISYSWDGDEHEEWVFKFARRLQGESGVQIILDRWHLNPGQDKLHFMEQAVATSDYVVIVCTEKYAQRANDREGGVGYESGAITSHMAEDMATNRFIPVLRQGSFKTSLPIYIKGRLGVNLSNEPYREDEYERLIRVLHGEPIQPPPIGKRPEFSNSLPVQVRPKRTPEAGQYASLEVQAESSCDFSPRALLHSKELSIKAFPIIEEANWSEEIELAVAAGTSEIDSIFSRFRGQKDVLVVAYGFDVALAKLKAMNRTVSAGKAIWRIQLVPVRTDFSNDLEMGTSGTSADEFAEKRVRRLLLNENPMAIKSDKGDMLARANELMFESLIQGLNSIVKIEHSTFIDLHADFGDDPIKFTEIAWISAVADLKLSAAIQQINHLKVELNRNVLNVDFSGRRYRKYVNVNPYEIEVNGSITFPAQG
jgi:hypothetical protein